MRTLALAVVSMVLFLSSSVPAATIAGLPDMNAANDAIADITYGGTTYVVADGDLVTGTTTRFYLDDAGAPTLWVEGDPAIIPPMGSDAKVGDVGSHADNFLLKDAAGAVSISSLDGISFQETVFATPKDTFFMFERGGNDTGTIQPILDQLGTLGTALPFSPGSPYVATGANSGQAVHGLVLTTDNPVWGFRVTATGHDAHSISAPVPEPTSMLLLSLTGLLLLRFRK